MRKMKMKRVFKCNFCFDSREVWDGTSKSYIPCIKCGNAQNLNDSRSPTRRERSGRISTSPIFFNRNVDSRSYASFPQNSRTLFYYLQGLLDTHILEEVTIIEVGADRYLAKTFNSQIVFKLGSNSTIIFGTRGDNRTPIIRRGPATSLLSRTIITADSSISEISTVLQSLRLPYFYRDSRDNAKCTYSANMEIFRLLPPSPAIPFHEVLTSFQASIEHQETSGLIDGRETEESRVTFDYVVIEGEDIDENFVDSPWVEED